MLYICFLTLLLLLDHSVSCYDLRYTATPVQSFSGHKKAVSYVRWIDDNQIISA